MRCWRLAILGKRVAVGGGYGGCWERGGGFPFFCYDIMGGCAGLAGRNKSGGHFSSALLSPYVKFSDAPHCLGLFSAGAEVLWFEDVYSQHLVYIVLYEQNQDIQTNHLIWDFLCGGYHIFSTECGL